MEAVADTPRQGSLIEPRLLGELHGRAPGPTLMVVAGLHGNEPSGVRAVRRVLSQLSASAGALRGDIVALAGNRRALAQDRRYVARDLNRQWTEDRVGALLRHPDRPDDVAEDLEQRELLVEFDRIFAAARGPVLALDLHTTSADGVPFTVVGDSPGSADFARRFPITRVLNLQRELKGVMMEYLGPHRGCMTLVVEGGQHRSPEAVERHVAVLWLALASAGLLPTECVPDLKGSAALLAAARGDAPREIRVFTRYAITPEDEFRMEPGFANIERVRAGQLLARDRNGEILAPSDAVLLMPLYQAQGDDGFFLGREGE